MKPIFTLFILALSGVGCVSNPFAENYRPADPSLVAAAAPAAPGAVPRLEPGRTPEQDAIRLLQEGYVLLGDAAFRSTEPSDKKAIAQARLVGADLVMMYRRNAQTVTGITSYPVSSTQSVAVRGPGGQTTHVLAHGTRTEYETYQYQLCDHVAVFWAKGGTPALGACWRELTTEEKQQTGSNKGAAIAAVVKRSPAFSADLLEGDILQAIDGETVLDAHQAGQLLETRRGQNVELRLRRQAGSLMVKVKLNP
jgi:hypothetical protein